MSGDGQGGCGNDSGGPHKHGPPTPAPLRGAGNSATSPHRAGSQRTAYPAEPTANRNVCTSNGRNVTATESPSTAASDNGRSSRSVI